MKLSYNWLSKFVDLKGISPDEVGKRITLHTAEVEEVEHLKPFFENVFAGKLLSTKLHPQSDKLSIAQFDLGAIGKKQIIYGQVHEVKVGEIYPIAVDGAKLKSGMEIKNTEIKGERSEGMIADNQELGMKNDGLIRWNDEKLIGKSLPEIEENFGDTIIEIDNKSLTHRPDLWGHAGFARELSAIFERKLNNKVFSPTAELLLPNIKVPASGEKVNIRIETDKCLRFCGLKISGVHIEPSELSDQILLENLGVRAISNLVDLTNLILTGWGQPMHVFDAKEIEGDLIVRQARKGEKLLALDGIEYELTPADTVVADSQKALSVAGIMGGEHSGVSDTTTDIVLESAMWDAVSIRHSSTRLGLRSDSSIRYEKSLDPEMCEVAIHIASQRTLEFCPKAKVSSPLTDNYPHKFKTTKISLSKNYLQMHSGLDIPSADIQKMLTAIGFEVSEKGDVFQVSVPTWRATKDVSIAEDLIEEVVRLYGFENIKETLPTLPVTPPKTNWLRRLDWKVRDVLSAKGFLEVKNYSFVDSKDRQFTGQKEYVKIENPLSDDHSHLRVTLISNIAKNIESELRTHGTMDIFEIGKEYHSTSDILPEEIPMLALFSAEIISGEKDLENKKFFALKSEIQNLFSELNISAEFHPAENVPLYAHPAKSAEIFVQGERIGLISSLHPLHHPAKNAVFVFAELNLLHILALTRKSEIHYTSLSPYPSSRRDISVVMDERILMHDLQKTARAISPLLKKIELFDEFTDDQKLGAGKKNLAFHLEFSSPKRTLEDTEIDTIFSQIVEAFQKEHQAQLRM